MSVEFPFEELDDVATVFPTLPNHDEVVAACPEEFWESNAFSNMAEAWFMGRFNPDTDLVGYEFTAESVEDAIMQRKNLEAWLGGYRPKHEDKIAVSGWLFSLMLEEK